MAITRFFRVVLRTLDVAGARRFYRDVLGSDNFHALPLHEQAIARGAPPHWLGFLNVPDVAEARAAFAARGAEALSPVWTDPRGLEACTMRDPGGAVIALARPLSPALSPADSRDVEPEVVWYSLNTANIADATRHYAELFGWDVGAPIDFGSLGVYFPFAWTKDGARVGSMADIAGRPGVHPHWLFHFAVAALAPALTAVRAAGGSYLEPVVLPDGTRIAVCHDPQGAAFALQERAR